MEEKLEAARQFMPFDALNGFRKILKQKEKIKQDKIELTDEAKEEISNILSELREEDFIKINYYSKEEYVWIEGNVKKIDHLKKQIVINNEEIRFSDILKIDTNRI